MTIVWIFLGVIVVLVIVLIFAIILRINNKKIAGELEYLAENYEINELNDTSLTYQTPMAISGNGLTYTNAQAVQLQAQQNQIIQLQSQIIQMQQQQASSVRTEMAKDAPLVDIPIPKSDDSEIAVEDASGNIVSGTSVQTAPVVESPKVEESVSPQPVVQIPSAPAAPIAPAVPVVNQPELTEESIVVKGSEQLQENGEEVVVPDNSVIISAMPAPSAPAETPAVDLPPVSAPPVSQTPVSAPQEVPVNIPNVTTTAFHSKHDGNTIINRNFKVEEPKKQFISYKTEIIDLTELREMLNNEKN